MADLPEKLQALAVGCDNSPTTEMTKVEMHATLGRIVVATADVGVGCVLIQEAPLMVWASNDWFDFLNTFESLPKVSRQGVLDMFHPPLDSETIQGLEQLAVHLKSRSSLDVRTIHKLLAISNTNAHEYYGKVASEFHEIRGAGEIRSGRSALFLYGSKVAHDCNPNTSYTSKTFDGKLEYKAIRPIAAGEMVTFSYLDKLFETPTHIRREKLLETKNFLCKCDRCLGPDYARQIRCPNSTCTKFIKCTNDGSGVSIWSCDNCGILQDVQVKLEKEEMSMKRRMIEVEQEMMANCMVVPLSRIESLIDTIANRFGPIHFLTLQARESHARLCASKAAEIESLPARGLPPHVLAHVKRQFGSAEQMRLASAKMGLSIAHACECIAAGCDGAGCEVESRPKHEPVYQTGEAVFFASQDLIKCHRRWPLYAIRMVKRYLPMMRILYGEADTDVAKIARAVAAFKVKDEETPAASPEASRTASTNRSAKKKKGGRGKTNKKKNRKR